MTGVAYIPYLTGLFPGRANIPGYRWFDRDRYQRRPLSVMRFRNYHGLGSYLMDRDLSKQAGHKVTVRYSEANGQKTAESVRVGAAAAKTASAKKTSTPVKKS